LEDEIGISWFGGDLEIERKDGKECG